MFGKCFRGMVVDVELDPVVGHEQGKRRPCVVVQNDTGNQYSPTTIIAPVTGAEHVRRLSPVHVLLEQGDGGLKKRSVVLCDQIRTVDQRRLRTVHGKISDALIERVNEALRVSLEI